MRNPNYTWDNPQEDYQNQSPRDFYQEAGYSDQSPQRSPSFSRGPLPNDGAPLYTRDQDGNQMNRGRNAGGSHYNRYRENPSYEDTPYSRNTRTSNTDHDPIQNQRYQSYDRQRDERVYDWSTKSWDNQNARSSKRNYQAQQSPRSLERQNYNDTREMTVSGHAQDHGRYDQGGYSNPYTRGRGAFYGQAPKGYTRSDEKIQEEVCEALTRADNIDKSDIEVKVKDGEVILSGSVQERWDKRRAEDICDSVMGVRNTQNNLKMSEKSDSDRNSTSKQSTSTSKNRTD